MEDAADDGGEHLVVRIGEQLLFEGHALQLVHGEQRHHVEDLIVGQRDRTLEFALGDVMQPKILGDLGIDQTRDHQVVAQRDRMPVVLGRPRTDDLLPGTEDRRLLCHQPVVGRHVVLGQQQREHCGCGIGRQRRRLIGVEIDAAQEGEVAAVVPRHPVMRVPCLGSSVVLFHDLRNRLFQGVEQLVLGQIIHPDRLEADPGYAKCPAGPHRGRSAADVQRVVLSRPHCSRPSYNGKSRAS